MSEVDFDGGDPAGHYAGIWETYWRATALDRQAPLWDVAADQARLVGLLDGGLPVVDLSCGNGTQTIRLAGHFAR